MNLSFYCNKCTGCSLYPCTMGGETGNEAVTVVWKIHFKAAFLKSRVNLPLGVNFLVLGGK